MRLPSSLRSCGSLLELDEVRRRLHLGTASDEGQQTIPVDRIIGTVGRAGWLQRYGY